MSDIRIATLFKNGGSQAVRLPREFRFSGNRVRVRRQGIGVLIEPLHENVKDWFAAMDKYGHEPFMLEGREQPPTPMPTRAVFE
jgi:antitoxin VapB